MRFSALDGSSYEHPCLFLDPKDRNQVYTAIASDRSDVGFLVNCLAVVNTSCYTQYGLYQLYPTKQAHTFSPESAPTARILKGIASTGDRASALALDQQ